MKEITFGRLTTELGLKLRKCTRCGARYKLVVEVAQTKKGDSK